MTLHRAVATVAVLALGLALTPTHTDAAYSWWTHPIAAVDADGRTWVGSVSSTGDVQVDIDGNRVIVDQVEADDHNAPAIALHPDRDTLVFNARHHKDNVVRWRTVSTDGTVGPTRTIDIGRRTTYVQALTGGDTVVVLTRGQECRWWAAISRDWGDTWRVQQLLDGCAYGKHVYLTTDPHPGAAGTFRIAAYGHPVQSDWRNIEYAYMRIGSGDIRIPGGIKVADLHTGAGLPLTPGDLDVVYRQPEGTRARLFDVGTVDGMPAVVFAEWDEPDVRGPARYRTVRYDDGWVPMDVGRYAGEPFWEPSNYLPGATFHDGDLWTASPSGLERWTWVGTWDAPTVIESGATVRPYSVRGGGVLWQQIHSYIDYERYDVTVQAS